MKTAGLARSVGALRKIVDRNAPQRWRHSLPAEEQPANPERLHEAERQLVYDIAKRWLEELERIAGEVGDIRISEPIAIPYVVGDPVRGKLFVGREEIMRELAAIWENERQLQSLILYGHRRMGKTSILKNLNDRLQATNPKIASVYINLQNVASLGGGLGELCHFLADEIADALNVAPPPEERLLLYPAITFRNFLKTLLKADPDRGLIVALDEYELLDLWLKKGKLNDDFIEILTSWIQLDERLAFVLAGWHDLEEMGDNWKNPVYGKFIVKPVKFLSADATYRLLREPNENFTLPYEAALLREIYRLTHGQPFLVNLVGFALVER